MKKPKQDWSSDAAEKIDFLHKRETRRANQEYHAQTKRERRNSFLVEAAITVGVVIVLVSFTNAVLDIWQVVMK